MKLVGFVVCENLKTLATVILVTEYIMQIKVRNVNCA